MNDINNELCTTTKLSQLLINCFHLDRIQWQKCNRFASLFLVILNAISSCLLCVCYNCIHVLTKYFGYGNSISTVTRVIKHGVMAEGSKCDSSSTSYSQKSTINLLFFIRIEWNRIEQNRIEQNRIEQNRIEWNGIEQNGIEQNRIEQN